MKELDYYIACICEGSAEYAIMEILLENNLLVFQSSQLLHEKVLHVRSAKNFERDYLNIAHEKKIRLYRILDSRKEKFKLSEFYRDKVEVIDVITAPEIEMLIIHSEDKYDDYVRKREKPSIYCKKYLKYRNVKGYALVSRYFSNPEILLNAIRIHHQKSSKYNDTTLYDLLSDEAS